MNLNPTFCIALSILLFLLPLIRSQTSEGGTKSISAGSVVCTAVVAPLVPSDCNTQTTGAQVCCLTTTFDAAAVATMTCTSYVPQSLPLQQFGAPLAANSKTNMCGSQATGVPAVIGSNSANCISVKSPQMDYTCTQFKTSDQSCCFELLYDAAANPIRSCKSFIPTGLPPAQTGLVGDPTSKTYVCNQIVPQPAGGPCINCPDYNDDEKGDPSDDKYDGKSFFLTFNRLSRSCKSTKSKCVYFTERSMEKSMLLRSPSWTRCRIYELSNE